MVFKKDLDLQKDWVKLLYKLKELTGKRPADLNSVLFLIGLQELGMGAKSFSKEEKQDIMHIAICKVLSLAGYYELEGLDEDGWPHWKLIKKLPRFDLLEQEKLLKIQILEYFKEEIGW
ncbi:hypothetical protein [Ekhidna sp.]|uniref:hypothetical protein n=1 Tax=Ekhidna sp. TaxID=2608089 RepID=UPI003CCC1090